MDTFELKDGRKVTIDWTSCESILAVSKSDIMEIKEQLDRYLRIARAQLNID